MVGTKLLKHSSQISQAFKWTKATTTVYNYNKPGGRYSHSQLTRSPQSTNQSDSSFSSDRLQTTQIIQHRFIRRSPTTISQNTCVFKNCSINCSINVPFLRNFSTTTAVWSHSSNSHDDRSGNDSYLPIFLCAEKYLENIAFINEGGKCTYADILHHAITLSYEITSNIDPDRSSKLRTATSNTSSDLKLNGERIALLTDHNASYVVGQYATWMVNGISVPLCSSHPPSEWEYFLKDSQCSLVLVSETFIDKISPVAEKLNIKVKCIPRDKWSSEYDINKWFQSDTKQTSTKYRTNHWFDDPQEMVLKNPALIVYTSGTTGPPKGVVLTHGNLRSMTLDMTDSWKWCQSDTLLHTLPLHHVHGIVNCLHTPLSCGATIVMAPKFDAENIWRMLIDQQDSDKHINLFMAVPTIYAKLLQYYDAHLTGKEKSIKESITKKFRLMVSGSAALPQPISDRWTQVSGLTLLERYGMTEIGMALTNPYSGPRVPGAVGQPFPSVEVRITRPTENKESGNEILAQGDSQHTTVTPGCEEQSGDLCVRGASVFSNYWRRPEVTKLSFTADGWFITGDTAVYKDGSYRIVGRTSVDVIKSGGYKISALDIERHLLAHPYITDCAVVGLPDLVWGQKVAAVLVLKEGKALELKDLRTWGSEHLAAYQLPSILQCLSEMPRNAMGKVNKKALVKQVFPDHVE